MSTTYVKPSAEQIQTLTARVKELEAKLTYTKACLQDAAKDVGSNGWVEVAPQWLLWLAGNLEDKQK